MTALDLGGRHPLLCRQHRHGLRRRVAPERPNPTPSPGSTRERQYTGSASWGLLSLARFTGEFYLGIGHRLAVHFPILGMPDESVLVNELIDIGGRSGPPVRQNSGRADNPTISLPLPVPLAKSSPRVKHPGANHLVAGIPTDALGDENRLFVLMFDRVIQDQKALVRGPMTGHLHVDFVRLVMPFADQPLQTFDLSISQAWEFVGL